MKKAMAHSEEAAVNVAMDAKEATTVAEEAGDCLEEGTQICFCECLKSFFGNLLLCQNSNRLWARCWQNEDDCTRKLVIL